VDFEGSLLGGDNATILETPESRLRRGKLVERPPPEQQEALYRQALTAWDGQGLQLSIEEKEMAKIYEDEEADSV
jgi:hypothetical protein